MQTALASASPLPPMPPLVRAINGIGGLLAAAGIQPRLDIGSLEAAARKQTGLSDFGDDSYRDPLVRLLRSLNEEAGLTPFGRMINRRRMIGLLRNRLEIERDQARIAGLADAPVERPTFVVGLPRTGTTILYHTLAQDPAVLSPLQWKLEHPSPPPEHHVAEGDPRVQATTRRIEFFYRLMPAFRAIHRLGATLPTECVVIKSHTFTTMMYALNFDVPSYQDWLLHADQRHAYRYHARFLRQVQHEAPGTRWLLKTPGHLLALDALFETYPDATVVHTHRDPLAVVASVSSLSAHLRALVGESVDPTTIGPAVSAFWEQALRRAAEFRASRPDLQDRFLDVRFDEICADPMGVVARLYAARGDTLEAPVRDAMQAFLDANPRGSGGRHRYTLEQYGLDPDHEARRFAWYRAAHGFDTDR